MTRRDPCAPADDGCSHFRCNLATAVVFAVFSGLASVLASIIDEHACDSQSNLAWSIGHKRADNRNADSWRLFVASLSAEPCHARASDFDIVAWNVVGPAHGRRVALKLDRAPNDDGLPGPCDDDVRGLPVSLRGFLENLHVQGLLGNHLLQPGILLLESLQLLGH